MVLLENSPRMIILCGYWIVGGRRDVDIFVCIPFRCSLLDVRSLAVASSVDLDSQKSS